MLVCLHLPSFQCFEESVSYAPCLGHCACLHDLVFGMPSHWVLGFVLAYYSSDFPWLSHAMFGCNGCSAIPPFGLVCALFCAHLSSMIWPHPMHVLALFWPILWLFWVALALWGSIDMAIIQVPWLALSFKSISMLCLSYVHDLASLLTWFQSLLHFHILMFIPSCSCLNIVHCGLAYGPMYVCACLPFWSLDLCVLATD